MESVSIRKRRRRIRHCAEEGDAACNSRARDRVPVLLVRAARFTRMHVDVNETRQPFGTNVKVKGRDEKDIFYFLFLTKSGGSMACSPTEA